MDWVTWCELRAKIIVLSCPTGKHSKKRTVLLSYKHSPFLFFESKWTNKHIKSPTTPVFFHLNFLWDRKSEVSPICDYRQHNRQYLPSFSFVNWGFLRRTNEKGFVWSWSMFLHLPKSRLLSLATIWNSVSGTPITWEAWHCVGWLMQTRSSLATNQHPSWIPPPFAYGKRRNLLTAESVQHFVPGWSHLSSLVRSTSTSFKREFQTSTEWVTTRPR